MGLIYRSSSLANVGASSIKNAALTYEEGDGNIAYLLTNLSGSNISIDGSTTMSGPVQINGNLQTDGIAYFTNLTSVSQDYVVTYASASGRFYYTASSKIVPDRSLLADSATSASYVLNAVSSSYAQTASYSRNLVVSGSISTVDYIDFTTTDGYPHLEGRIHWDDTTKTLQIDTDNSNFSIDAGHQSVVRVYNDTGADIQAGRVVYIDGAQGNTPTVATASWEIDPSSAGTIGFAATTISGSGGNRHGYIVTNGLITNINTNGFTVGDRLFLSSSGQFTNVAPDAPLHEVRLGVVVVSNATTGIIYVNVVNGFELTELHDVRTLSESNGDLLVYSSSLWTNSKQLSGSYGITGSLTLNGSPLGSAFPYTGSARVSGSVIVTGSIDVDTATGKSFLAAGYAQFFEPYSGFYGTIPLKPINANATQSASPAWWASPNGGTLSTAGGVAYYASNQNLGHRVLNPSNFTYWAGAIKLVRNNLQQDAGNGIFPYHTVITNNATEQDTLISIATTLANNRYHVLTVTGSFLVRDGVSLGTNISNTHIITGSVNVTGSTTQTGNNTLIGNTVLSGSVGISGSQTFYGISAFYGNHTLSGSNTITGNTIMSGSIRVSGSSTFNNSQFTVTGSTSILGNFNVQGTSVFSNTTFTVTGSQYFTGSSFINGDQSLTGNSTVTGSLNVVGNINVVSGSSFTRWGNKLFNYAQFANTASVLATANVSASFTLPLTYFTDGVTVVSSSRVTFQNTGLYSLHYTAIANQGVGTPALHLWFKKTGSNIDNSSAQIQLENNSQTSISYNFAYPFTAGEYVELWYHTSTANTSFPYSAAGSGFPATPSIVLTVTQIA